MAVRVPIGPRGDGGPATVPEPATFDDVLADASFLQRYCERLLGDAAGAEDIVQETYLQAFRRVGDLDTRGSFAPWLATVARHAILKELRRRRRLHLVDDLPDAAACADLEPEEVVESQESIEATVHALDTLNERERALLMRQVRDGLSIAELAAEEDSSVSSVKSVLNRARAKLRAVVDEAHARVLAPLAAVAASARRHFEEAGWRVQQAAPAGVGGLERMSEVVTAALATLVIGGSVTASTEPSLAFDGLGRALPTAAVSGAGPAADVAEGELGPPAGRVVAAASPLRTGTAGREVAGGGGWSGPASSTEPYSPGGVEPAPLPPAPDPGEPVDPPEAPSSPLPKDDGDDPEGSFLKDITWVAGSSADGGGDHVFALGELKARCDSGCGVLFHSDDGGATWRRLPAEGLGDDAHTLLVAPGYPADPRLYVVTPSGMRRSLDGGRSFHSVNQPHSAPAVISPAFSRGDQRILVGAGPGGWAYDAGADATAPFSPGSFATTQVNFAFAPDDAATVFAGHFVHGDGGAKRPAVTRCVGDVCDQRASLPGTAGPPSVFVTTRDEQGRSAVFAWHDGGLFRSTDGGTTFEKVEADVPGNIAALAEATDGSLYLAWWREDAKARTGGVLRSGDGGRRWTAVGVGTELDTGVHAIEARGNRVLAAPRWNPEGGLLCTADGGRTWLSRCPGEVTPG